MVKDLAKTMPLQVCAWFVGIKGMKTIERDGSSIFSSRESVEIFSILMFLKVWKKQPKSLICRYVILCDISLIVIIKDIKLPVQTQGRQME